MAPKPWENFQREALVSSLGLGQKCRKCPSSHRILQYLFDNTWLDCLTRAVFVEFTVYNANVNLFCIITLTLETSALGEHLPANPPAEFWKINPPPLPLGYSLAVPVSELQSKWWFGKFREGGLGSPWTPKGKASGLLHSPTLPLLLPCLPSCPKGTQLGSESGSRP